MKDKVFNVLSIIDLLSFIKFHDNLVGKMFVNYHNVINIASVRPTTWLLEALSYMHMFILMINSRCICLLYLFCFCSKIVFFSILLSLLTIIAFFCCCYNVFYSFVSVLSILSIFSTNSLKPTFGKVHSSAVNV